MSIGNLKNQKGFVQLGIFGVILLLGAVIVGTKLVSNPDLTFFNISEEAQGVDQQRCSGCDGEYLLTWRGRKVRGEEGGVCTRKKSAACRPRSTPKPTPTSSKCIVGGCNSELCGEEGKSLLSPCVALPKYACYKTAKCERQKSGLCGWTQTSELTTCLEAN